MSLKNHKYREHIEAKYAEWLDNTNLDNLGIVKWAKQLLPEYTPNSTPHFHIVIYMLLLSLLDPEFRNKYERLRNIIVFRGGAKSTIINKIFGAYLLANNGKKLKVRKIKFIYENKVIVGIEPTDEIFEVELKERFIVLASETGGSAEAIITDLRNEFATNEKLRYYYQFEVKDAIESDTGQWTQKAFRLNNCYIMGVGTGYQIRGKIRGASRPTFMIFDDIYSENNIGEGERPKIATWFDNAAINSIDDLKGKACVINTIVHEDTVPVALKKDKNWKTIEIPLMPVENFHKFVTEHMRIDSDTRECVLPFEEIEDEVEQRRKQREYFDDVQKNFDWKLAWPDRIDLYEIALKYRGAVAKGNTSGLYQEYFHKVLSPDDQRFKPEYFQKLKNWELKWEYGYNWININNEEDAGGQKVWRNIVIEFGVDQSTGLGKDDSVIIPEGTLQDGRMIVFPPVFGKFSDRDDMAGDIGDDLRLDKVIMDRSKIRKIGLYDELFRLYLRYRPVIIKIGCGPSEKGVASKVRRLFHANKVYDLNIIERPQTVREKEKSERIRNTLLHLYETRMVYHTSNCEKLEYQLEYLGKADNDDIADGLEVAVWQRRFPSGVTYDFFKPNEKGIPPELLDLNGRTWDKIWKYA